ncbi:MAG: hypothetical protein DRP09_16335 [Candidatus Thorarchaeota archaeon]|nr:MAG: hypothetical protein DRP09_16335 [Candidatus Thorarchaeota archaeon]
MARSQVTDLLQQYRFHAVASDTDGNNPLHFGADAPGGEAGFQSITIPETSLEPVEYREGHYKHSKKYNGPPTVSDTTFMRGVAMEDTSFIDWIENAIDGGEYRADITVYRYRRDEEGERAQAQPSQRSYIFHECIPTRVKPDGDLDSATGDVSLAEVDAAMEWCETVKG